MAVPKTMNKMKMMKIKKMLMMESTGLILNSKEIMLHHLLASKDLDSSYNINKQKYLKFY